MTISLRVNPWPPNAAIYTVFPAAVRLRVASDDQHMRSNSRTSMYHGLTKSHAYIKLSLYCVFRLCWLMVVCTRKAKRVYVGWLYACKEKKPSWKIKLRVNVDRHGSLTKKLSIGVACMGKLFLTTPRPWGTWTSPDHVRNIYVQVMAALAVGVSEFQTSFSVFRSL